MAVQDFKKHQEIFRALLLEGGGYTRVQFAAALGISPDNFDRSITEIENMAIKTKRSGLERENDRGYVFSRFKYDHYKANQNFFALLYQTRVLKETERERMATILRLLKCKAYKIENLAQELSDSKTTTEQKTISNQLKELMQIGIVEQIPGSRPAEYQLKDPILNELSKDELLNLCDYVNHCANTETLCVSGYLINDVLSSQLKNTHKHNYENILLYRYNFFGRVLDEYVISQLLTTIEEKNYIELSYQPKITNMRYQAKPTNKKYAKPDLAEKLLVIPLCVVYDCQYGRWYLLGREDEKTAVYKYRIENIVSVNIQTTTVPPENLDAYLAEATELLANAWVLGGKNPGLVKLKFYMDGGKSEAFFIKDRLLREGQHGRIVYETDDSFIFEVDLNDVLEIKPWIRSFGASVEVLEPLALRKDIAQEWEEIRCVYNNV